MAAGDLVLVAQSPTYEVGDVVAYSSTDLQQTVLHRVVAIENGQYTFRGDHNDFDDPEQPTTDQLIGKELLHIPQGMTWMDRLTSPPVLALLAFGLLATGGAATRSLHRRRKRPMAQHPAVPRPTGIPQRLRTAAGIAASAAMIGLLLAAFVWTRPATTSDPGTSPDVARMDFAYSAPVAASPAYDGTTVTSPAPLFRKLVEEVELKYTYHGDPGQISVAAELSAASGWRAQVPLHDAVTTDGSKHTATIDLDLGALQTRANAAARAIAIPSAQTEVTIVPAVETVDGKTFSPRLTFVLTDLKFELAEGASSLAATESTTAPDQPLTPTINLAGRDISVSSLRTTSAVLALGGLLALAGIIVLSRRGPTTKPPPSGASTPPCSSTSNPSPPRHQARRRRRRLPTLARLAERYGLLILPLDPQQHRDLHRPRRRNLLPLPHPRRRQHQPRPATAPTTPQSPTSRDPR